jgi:hypothetical protein
MTERAGGLNDGDWVMANKGGMVGEIIKLATVPDLYGDAPAAIVEWDYRGTKVRTYAMLSQLVPLND